MEGLLKGGSLHVDRVDGETVKYFFSGFARREQAGGQRRWFPPLLERQLRQDYPQLKRGELTAAKSKARKARTEWNESAIKLEADHPPAAP